jgi:5'-3' exonuclease
MGIPYLFAHLRRRFPISVRDVDPTVSGSQYDSLYLDFNSIVHEAANYVASDAGADAAVISESLKRLTSIATCPLLRPRRLLYVAVDGPPPLAKMHQQRSRRFGAHQMRTIEDLRSGSYWDRNQISPGTPFMRRLDAALQACCADLRNGPHAPEHVIANPHSEPGEGEQKIFTHISESEHEGARIVVYGVDADLILMSLLSPAWDRIDLFRPGIVAAPPAPPGGGRTRHASQQQACILQTPVLRSKLACDIDVRDFVVLCLLLGNDFIPSLAGFQLRNDGLLALVSIFQRCVGRSTAASGGALLAEGGADALGGIRLDALLALLSGVADAETRMIKEEDASYKERCTRHQTQRRSEPPAPAEMNPLEHPESHIVNFVHHRGDADEHWRLRYYHALFEGGAASSSSLIRSSSLAFLTGLGWAYAYVGRQRTIAPGWVYPHAYAPLALDLQHLLSEPVPRLLADIDAHLSARNQMFDKFRTAVRKAATQIAWARGEHPDPVFIELLLFAILPPSSLDRAVTAVDPRDVTGAQSQAGFLFPDRCVLRTYLRERGWECRAVLPPLDMDVLAAAITGAASATAT